MRQVPPDLDRLCNELFAPSKALRSDERDLFSGRSGYFKEALDALAVDASSLLVHGERGVGKTSFAWQLMEMLSGKKKLRERLGIGVPPGLSRRTCLWVECRDTYTSIADALLSVIAYRPPSMARDLSFPKLFPKVYEQADVVDHIQRKYGINLGVASFNATVVPRERAGGMREHVEQLRGEATSIETRVRDAFEDLVQAARSVYKLPELFLFIDELDRLQSKAGIGSLLKYSGAVRFVLVGIAENQHELIEDHESSLRKLSGIIALPALTDTEVEWLYDRAEQASATRKQPVPIRYSRAFREAALSYAAGYPWPAQHFGWYATHAALEETFSGATAPEMPVEVEPSHFMHATGSVLQKLTLASGKSIEDVIEDSETRLGIIEAIALASEPLPMERLRDQLRHGSPPLVDSRVEALAAAKVLKKTPAGYRFFDPVARILAKLYLDERSMSGGA
jgi:hypothetical protein